PTTAAVRSAGGPSRTSADGGARFAIGGVNALGWGRPGNATCTGTVNVALEIWGAEPGIAVPASALCGREGGGVKGLACGLAGRATCTGTINVGLETCGPEPGIVGNVKAAFTPGFA